MSIETRLGDDLKAAMRAKDSERVACIRQLKAKMQETVNAKGFQGEVDDTLYQKVLSSYAKSLEKGISELQAAGEKGAPLRAKYQAEIDYVATYLPELLGEEETRAIVQGAIESLGVTDPKQAGRVMGSIMKDHKGTVDAGLVRKLVDAALSA